MSGHRDYSETLLDHYRNPRNVGDLSGANAVATVGHPQHGDVMRLSLRIEQGKVAEARFKAFGCAVAIAAGSIATQLVQGLGLDELPSITNSKVAEALGGVPDSKKECSMLVEQALREALITFQPLPSEAIPAAQTSPIRGAAAQTAEASPRG